MKILLLANYAPDAQQSMLRFGDIMRQGLEQRGLAVEVMAPTLRWRARLPAGAGAAAVKWAGYFDKYLEFPRALRRRLAAPDGMEIVHVLDHSNAVYVPDEIRSPKWVVTCHDLLAVRGALGEDTDCPASALGKRLQRRIVAGLSRATAIASVSTCTRSDLDRLVPHRGQDRRVILQGLNYDYRPVDAREAHERLTGPGVGLVPWGRPFLLHVGSNLRRKNKTAVLRVFARMAASWPGNLVLCGAPLTEELRAMAAAAGVAERVFAIESVDNAQLAAIYSLAHALLFPSRGEGFGWPIIEAQACGCPVICSDRTSLSEVVGDPSAVYALDDEAGMAAALLRWTDVALRGGAVARGFENVRRFSTARMIGEYEAFYRDVLAGGRQR